MGWLGLHLQGAGRGHVPHPQSRMWVPQDTGRKDLPHRVGGTPTSLKVKETSGADTDLPLPAGRERLRRPQGPQVHLRTRSLCLGPSPHHCPAPSCRALATPASLEPRGPAPSSPALALQGTPGSTVRGVLEQKRQDTEGGPRPPAHLRLLVWAAAVGGLTLGS